MKEITKIESRQGHGKSDYLVTLTEIQLIALYKELNGKRLKKGSPLWNSLKDVRQMLPVIEVSVERMADLLNPMVDYQRNSMVGKLSESES